MRQHTYFILYCYIEQKCASKNTYRYLIFVVAKLVLLLFVQVADKSYSMQTQNALSRLSEKEVSFELLQALLDYIKSLNIDGAVLVFLPGWNLIFKLMKHLQQHPVYGGSQYSILPLHSQLPREDQRKVFQSVPPDVTKVKYSLVLFFIFQNGFLVGYFGDKHRRNVNHHKRCRVCDRQL